MLLLMMVIFNIIFNGDKCQSSRYNGLIMICTPQFELCPSIPCVEYLIMECKNIVYNLFIVIIEILNVNIYRFMLEEKVIIKLD